MQERRESRRNTFHLRTEVLLNEGQEQIGLLRANVAFGGIGGFSRDLVQEGQPAVVRIYFPQRGSEKETSENIPGLIIWKKQDGNFTALGVRFSTLQRGAHPLLHSYLNYADQFD